MSEQLNPELIRQTTIRLIDYQSPAEALMRYVALPQSIKEQMAGDYQKGFGAEPWFERCRCPGCGTFEKESTCSRCGIPDLPPAYPTESLINDEFPNMLTSFSPGTLVLAQNSTNEVVGFCAGGMVTLSDLIAKKYNGNERVMRSINDETGLTIDEPFFYENEMVVVPWLQGNGIGSALNQARLEWISKRNIGAVLGRTINPNLLKMKERQFPQWGFSMKTFVPEGDGYQVDGLQRQCYFAVRIR